ncbi:hypothetical protein SEA_JACOREN57_24 [Mycobacterium phage JacoRen57]|nr:hypothetical protein SEA_JACOREN57_24 [Mycobacterium phage JacoRen57]
MAKAYSVTPTVAQGMLSGSTSFAEALGTSPKMKIYSGTPPANAGAALSGNTLLATLTCAATPIASSANTGSAIRATWAAIASAVAAATGTATFFRTTTSGDVVIDQGTVDTTGADLNMSTTALTAGSTVALSSRTSDFPFV